VYGTVARMRVKPGAEPLLQAQLEALQSDPGRGWVSTTFYRSDADPQLCWLAVVYESEETYRANAARENQHAVYIRLRAALEDDPEWFDGEILNYAAAAQQD
jgi:hypothetical protein